MVIAGSILVDDGTLLMTVKQARIAIAFPFAVAGRFPSGVLSSGMTDRERFHVW